MAVLDTDFASETYTCMSDNEDPQEGGEDQDDGLNAEMARRREKAGLGLTAKMVVGPMWRNPDVSSSRETIILDGSHLIASTLPSPAGSPSNITKGSNSEIDQRQLGNLLRNVVEQPRASLKGIRRSLIRHPRNYWIAYLR